MADTSETVDMLRTAGDEKAVDSRLATLTLVLDGDADIGILVGELEEEDPDSRIVRLLYMQTSVALIKQNYLLALAW